VVFLLIEFPLRQQKSVSFIFCCALIFVDTYAHALFLKSISFFQAIKCQRGCTSLFGLCPSQA
jgi:hypothetical protein